MDAAAAVEQAFAPALGGGRAGARSRSGGAAGTGAADPGPAGAVAPPLSMPRAAGTGATGATEVAPEIVSAMLASGVGPATQSAARVDALAARELVRRETGQMVVRVGGGWLVGWARERERGRFD
jgi:hypothetical protein